MAAATVRWPPTRRTTSPVSMRDKVLPVGQVAPLQVWRPGISPAGATPPSSRPLGPPVMPEPPGSRRGGLAA